MPLDFQQYFFSSLRKFGAAQILQHRTLSSSLSETCRSITLRKHKNRFRLGLCPGTRCRSLRRSHRPCSRLGGSYSSSFPTSSTSLASRSRRLVFDTLFRAPSHQILASSESSCNAAVCLRQCYICILSVSYTPPSSKKAAVQARVQ